MPVFFLFAMIAVGRCCQVAFNACLNVTELTEHSIGSSKSKYVEESQMNMDSDTEMPKTSVCTEVKGKIKPWIWARQLHFYIHV